MRLIKCSLLFLVMSVLLAGCSFIQTSPLQAEKGILKLDQWDFSRDGNIKLDGEWEFYWEKLLNYSDFKNGGLSKPVTASIPNAWTEYEIDGKSLPGSGFGTYRLHVKSNLAAGTLLSLRFNTFSSAYIMYINDKEVASNGRVSGSKETYTPEYRPLTAVFAVPGSEFDIIIQAANYDFYRGGFWYSINLGNPDDINSYQNLLTGKEFFIIGALSLIALYYIALFFVNRKDKMYLYFAAICILFIFIFDVLGEVLICRVFPHMPFSLFVFIWYGSIQWISFFLVLYVGELFPVRFKRTANLVFGLITAACTALFIFTPVHFYTNFGHIGDFLMLLGVVYSFIPVIEGVRQKKQGSVLYIIAMFALLITAAHDSLFLANVIKSKVQEIAFIGVFVLLFVHSLIHVKICKRVQ
jgi:hypothetical protein